MTPDFRKSTNCSLGLFLLCFTSLVGCARDEITSYRVARVEPKTVQGESVRMLGAILETEQEMWFFKLLDEEARVAEVVLPFKEFLETVRLEGGDATWTAPEDWKRRPGNSVRFATLEIGDGKDPLEISVTRLGPSPVLENVNRWRGQVSLSPISADDLKQETTQIMAGELSITLVDLVGTSGRRGMGGGSTPPFMGGPMGGASGGGASKPAPAAPRGVPQMMAPEGWQPQPGGGISVATWMVDGAEVTVTPLGGPAGGVPDNTRRWASQVGIQIKDASELESFIESIEIGQLRGHFVTLIPEKGKEAILGAIVQAGETTWFFKMRGPVNVVKSKANQFRSFVQEVRFPAA